jgi:hypothetical protein
VLYNVDDLWTGNNAQFITYFNKTIFMFISLVSSFSSFTLPGTLHIQMDMKTIGSIYYENYVSAFMTNVFFLVLFPSSLPVLIRIKHNNFLILCYRLTLLAWCRIKGPQEINPTFHYINPTQPIISKSCICSSHSYPSHVSIHFSEKERAPFAFYQFRTKLSLVSSPDHK